MVMVVGWGGGGGGGGGGSGGGGGDGYRSSLHTVCAYVLRNSTRYVTLHMEHYTRF